LGPFNISETSALPEYISDCSIRVPDLDVKATVLYKLLEIYYSSNGITVPGLRITMDPIKLAG